MRLFLPIFLLFSIYLNATMIELSKEEKNYIEQNPFIKVSNELDWYPYDFNEHDEADGYAVDYLTLLADKIGLHVVFVPANWSTLQEKFKANELDVLYPATKTKKREKIALFSDEFLTMRLSLITKIKANDIKSLDDMSGKVLAVVKGWSSAERIKTKYKDIKFLELSTSKGTLEAVAFGLADATIEDFFTANYIIKKEMFSNLHVASKINLYNKNRNSLHLMFQKNNTILQGLFNKALKRVKEEELLKIKIKWIGLSEKSTSGITINAEEKNYLFNKQVIKMCIDPDWMPLEMIKDGKHIGMTSDYIKLIEEKLGIPIKLVDTKTWMESIEFAKQRKCDIFSLAMPTPERKLYMNFTKPYLSIPLVLVSKLDEIFYSDVGTIKNKPIGIVKGYAYGEILKVKYPNMKLVEVKNVTEGLDKVEKEELFGFVGTLATVAYRIQGEYFGSLKIVGKFDEKWELGVGVRNDEPALLGIFEKAIKSIDKDKHQEILNKWISVNYTSKTDFKYLWEFLILILTIAVFLIYRQYQIIKYNKQLERLSSIDKLTGVYNRLKLDDIMIYEKKLFDRFKRPLSIILFDIDDFKQVNDQYGHQTGDIVLQEIAQIILDNKRQTDVFGRWGGEEFLIICHETDIGGAVALAEKFRKAICSYHFEEVESQSASFGVSEFKKDETIEKIFDKADKALYKSKKEGKNLVSYLDK